MSSVNVLKLKRSCSIRSDVNARRNAVFFTEPYLQLHHGVLAEFISTCRGHVVNSNQLGFVAYPIASEALYQSLLAAVLTCMGGKRERFIEKVYSRIK